MKLPTSLSLAFVTLSAVTSPYTSQMSPTRLTIWLGAVLLGCAGCIWLHGRLVREKPFDPGPYQTPEAPYPETPGFAWELLATLGVLSVLFWLWLLS